MGGPASGYDYATVAYAANGSQQWVRRYAGPGGNTDDAKSVAVGPNGKTVYVTGQSWGGQTPAWDYATVAYDAVSGAQQWVKRYNGPGNAYDLPSSVAVSPTSRTVYVAGQSAGVNTGADYATIAYTATGTQRWVKRPTGTVLYPSSITVSRTTATVFVTGTNTGDYTTIAYQG